MSWSAALLAAWRDDFAKRRTLIKVELASPSALTLYLADADCSNDDGVGGDPVSWEAALLQVGDVLLPGEFLSSAPDPCTFDFAISPQELGAAAGAQALDLFWQYQWEGATVTAWRWVEGLDFDGTDGQFFKGKIERIETEEFAAHVWAVGPTDWAKDIPQDVVGRSIYPRSPEKSIGQIVPICYGKLRTPEARPPASDYGTFQQGMTSVAGGRRAGVRGTVVSIGSGTLANAEVLFASHECKVFSDETKGSTPLYADNDKLCDLDVAVGNAALAGSINDATGCGFYFTEVTSAVVDPFTVFLPVFGADAQLAASNNADALRSALDVFNDTSYTLLDYDASKRQANYHFPDIPAGGLNRALYFVVGYSMSSGTNLVATFVNPTKVTTDPLTLTASTGIGDITAESQIVSVSGPTETWNLGQDGCYVVVEFSGVNTGKSARIFYVGVTYKRRPTWPVVTPGHMIQVPGHLATRRKKILGIPEGSTESYWTQPHDEPVPEKTRVEGQFYATLDGWADDGSGTDTGVADALIERPTDMLRHFLVTYCGQDRSTQIDSTALDALRAEHTTWKAHDMVLAYAIDERRRSAQIVSDLMGSVLSRAYVSRTSNKWTAFAWKASKTTTYDIPLRREDLLVVPKIERRVDLVCNQFQLGYGMDAWTRRPVHDVRLRSYESNGGHFYRNLRDGYTTVEAGKTDKLDFSDGTSRTVTLTTGAYEPIDLAQHVAGLIAAVTTNSVCQIAYGFTIVAGYNNKLDFKTSGTPFTATFTAGDYTGAALASHIQTQMNAVSANWSCSYSATTGLFTFGNSNGSAQNALSFGTGTNVATGCATLLGFAIADVTHAAAFTATSAFAVYPQQFAIGLKTSTLSLLFESGTNGIDAATPRTCGALFGFDTSRDYAEGVSYAVGHSPVTAGEAECLLSEAGDGTLPGYGQRPARVTMLPAVFDTDTAREVRLRLQDLTMPDGGVGVPTFGTFTTPRMPDFEQGMVFETHESIDEWVPFMVAGSDGSWDGKKWLIVSGADHTHPAAYQEVVALLVS